VPADRVPAPGAVGAVGSSTMAQPSRPSPPRRPWWPWAKRVLATAFMALVLALLVNLGRRIDWAGAVAAVQALPAATLLAAAALAALSHGLYCCYDLIGRHQTGHGLPRRSVVTVGFISYAFNLNLGSLVGGVAFRYRLYTQLGLGADVITHVLGLSLLTNWLGYVFVGGLVLLLHPPALAAAWVPAHPQVLGAVLLLAVAAYGALCLGARRREWQLASHQLRLPSGRLALLQLALSSLNWLLIAAVVHVLLQQRVEYATVLGVLLLAAVAGVVTHVPAGLGVLEAVFLTLLSQLPQAELLGALLAYRFIYYLVPLALASALFLATRKGVLAARS